jgi:hypothetical protein
MPDVEKSLILGVFYGYKGSNCHTLYQSRINFIPNTM